MGLSSDLISQFVKVTNDNKEPKKETTVYGTTVTYEGRTYVKIDGSDRLTPISTTADIQDGERVTVMIKNHTATVTGNMSSPAARTDDVKGLGSDYQNLSNKIDEFDIIVADKVDTEALAVVNGRIDYLVSDNVVIKKDISAAKADISQLQTANATITEKLTAAEADIDSLETKKLDADIANVTYATIDNLKATNADIHNLESTYAEFESTTTTKLAAHEASISELQTKKLDAETAEITYAKITDLGAATAKITNLEGTFSDFKVSTTEKLAATDASIEDLQTNKLSASDIEGKYANIDFSNIGKAAMEYFYSESGLIQDVVVGDAVITGELVGVTISGELIKGNTVVADKLVIKGSDGLYYKLNADGVTTEAEQTDYNSLNGQVIKAKSITATKISVDDLVAFDATIGGFNITDSSIHSGVKSSVDNTTSGLYMDKEGQLALGDASSFIKYYKDQNGDYHLEISAQSVLMSTTSASGDPQTKTIEQAIEELTESSVSIQADVDAVEVRLSDAETEIAQNTEAIALRATKTEVSESLKGYYTKEQTDSAITVKANEITSSVSSTYATKTALSQTDTKATNAQADVDALETRVGSAETSISQNTEAISLRATKTEVSTAKSEAISTAASDATSKANSALASAKEYADSQIEISANSIRSSVSVISEEIIDVQSIAESANDKAINAQTLIEQLSDSIATLVTDSNGESLMVQTESGWTFSTSQIQSVIDTTSENLDSLTNEVGDVSSTVSILQQAVADLGVLSEYVKITTYEDEPCIELGELDSDFKLLITNTRILFMEGSGMPAYMTNQSVHIKKAVVEEELLQGGFVWKIRSNGNMGLMWKGVSS